MVMVCAVPIVNLNQSSSERNVGGLPLMTTAVPLIPKSRSITDRAAGDVSVP